MANGTSGDGPSASRTADLPVVTDNEGHTKTDPVNPDLTWLSGPDGVAIQPGAPALPKQIKNVTVAGQVLRGVGFWGGTTRTCRASCP